MTAIPVGAGAPAHKPVSKSVVAATVAGNAIEFYDFISFAFFAVYIAGAFFPAGDDFSNLLKTLAVFWAGFIFRPLGGVVIGAYADRAGRRAAMMLTIALITIGTMGLALIPSYATIGAAAPLLLVVCRVIQGFALGGEVGPASVFLVEAAPPGKRAFYGSWQLASQGMAVMASGLLGVALSVWLTKAQLADWGWRIPFIVCLILIPVAFFLRNAMPETLEHVPQTKGAPRPSLLAHWHYIALAVLTIIGGTVSTYVGNYMSTYAINTLKLPATVSLSATFIGGAATFVFSLVSGLIADRFGRRGSVIWPRIALVIVIWPLFQLLSSYPSAATLYLAAITVSGLTALSAAGGLVLLPELLPKPLRATGFSVAYAIGVSIFGGSTQFVITWLIGATGDPTSPAWYVVVTSLITIAAIYVLPETKDRDVS
jgi:MFS family permease